MRPIATIFVALCLHECSALRLAATAVRHGRIRCQEDEPASAPTAAPVLSTEAATEEDEFNDPLGDSDFVRWYRMEKAREAYKKENPPDPLRDIGNRLKGPASSLAILAGGFYIIPLIRGTKEAIELGDAGKVAEFLGAPTTALN